MSFGSSVAGVALAGEGAVRGAGRVHARGHVDGDEPDVRVGLGGRDGGITQVEADRHDDVVVLVYETLDVLGVVRGVGGNGIR